MRESVDTRDYLCHGLERQDPKHIQNEIARCGGAAYLTDSECLELFLIRLVMFQRQLEK